MNFDINEVLAEMLAAVKNSLMEDWGDTKSVVNQFMQRRKERLELLADLRINNELSQKRFESRLEDEKLLIEAELHSIAIISKVMAQNAANAAINVFNKAISIALKTVI